MFTLIGLAITVGIGILSGWLAGQIMKSEGSWLHNLILGVVGSFVGGFIAGLLGIYTTSFSIGGIAISVAGACLCIWIYRKYIK